MPKVSQEHRQQRREQILLAAMVCVAEEGFHKTTMAHVITASGLSAGAVYGYFASKEQLILAIADQALGYAASVLGDVRAMDPVPSPVDLIEFVTTGLIQRAEAAPVDITRVVVAAWAEAVRDETVRSAVAQRFGQLREELAEIVVAQQRAGHVADEAEPLAVAKSLFGVLPGFILQRLVTQDVTPQEYAAGYAAMRPRASSLPGS